MEGVHIECKKREKFTGNFLFASLNLFKYLTPSRRDDLISLAYLLIYYLLGEVTWASKIYQVGNIFEQVRKIKIR